MLKISDNIYNSRVGRDRPKFKIWRSAGLMITYQCSAACRFCYYHCGPAKSPVMPLGTAIRAWEGLKALAGDDAKIHLTGGEPFLEWERLEQIAREGKRAGLGPIDHIETNGSWASDEKIISERVRVLAENGMEVLKISCDPFHQEFINIENVRRLARTAREILGPGRVMVRWEKYLEEPVLTGQMSPAERDAAHIESLKDFPIRFTGRAGGELAELGAGKTIEDISCRNCSGSFLGAKGVHIDPMGNVFSGVCSGIVVGNVNSHSLASIWQQIDWQEDSLTGILFKSGPAGLVENAVKAGYEKRRFYNSSCHLCTSIRQFYYNIGSYTSIIGPAECYAEAAAGEL